MLACKVAANQWAPAAGPSAACPQAPDAAVQAGDEETVAQPSSADGPIAQPSDADKAVAQPSNEPSHAAPQSPAQRIKAWLEDPRSCLLPLCSQLCVNVACRPCSATDLDQSLQGNASCAAAAARSQPCPAPSKAQGRCQQCHQGQGVLGHPRCGGHIGHPECGDHRVCRAPYTLLNAETVALCGGAPGSVPRSSAGLTGCPPVTCPQASSPYPYANSMHVMCRLIGTL